MDHLSVFKPKHLRVAKLRSKSVDLARYGNRKLIVIQLSGGNDGLNTIIPFRNDTYYKARPKLAIKAQQALSLDTETSCHKSLIKFKSLFDKGLVTIINSVGYPNPIRSHFSSMDIWHTGSLKVNKDSVGWIGRYLDHYGDYENQLGAVELNDVLSLALKGNHTNGIAVNDFLSFFKELKNPSIYPFVRSTPNIGKQNKNLQYIYDRIKSGYYALEPIVQQYKTAKIKSNFSRSEFGKDCKSVADLIISGSPSKIYYISHGSFDTHVKQAKTHQALLKVFSDNLFELVKTLKAYDQWNDVSILVFSEFGRRVAENRSIGTDHGAANNVFLISDQLNRPGFYNEPANLTDLHDGDIKFEIDFRSVYTDILSDWLGVNAKLILNERFRKLNLFKTKDILS